MLSIPDTSLPELSPTCVCLCVCAFKYEVGGYQGRWAQSYQFLKACIQGGRWGGKGKGEAGENKEEAAAVTETECDLKSLFSVWPLTEKVC